MLRKVTIAGLRKAAFARSRSSAWNWSSWTSGFHACRRDRNPDGAAALDHRDRAHC
jgi:hypothetical protein